ncbi:hypothetical protein [Methylobacterium sp. WL6]|uniref:hypothetical protein n=1 Tax=Methylobacterium sp. WL6 TaxID=2603901 RepID=UPI0011CA8FDB|nr:hypothetical protein [Methylobacterium sp. WL6]TXN72388.1 hypothetical protein FV230_05015 [Methylobacterium sp. WL6]
MMILAALESRLPTLLAAAEIQFGPKEPGWAIAGVATADNGPVLHRSANDELTVYLNSKLHTEDQGLFQLAHEVVHLLAPVRKEFANTLEEGCAVWFSLYGVSYQHPGYADKAKSYIENDPSAAKYKAALKDVVELLSIDEQAVRKIRGICPRFENVTAGLITEILPNVPLDLAHRLVELQQMRVM